MCVAGVCRICVVELDNQPTLQTACSFPITSPVVVKTSNPTVRKAKRHILDLLRSEHHGGCYACFRNKRRELQRLAKEYGVDFYHFGHVTQPAFEVDLFPML